jgi:hypothetical protein
MAQRAPVPPAPAPRRAATFWRYTAFWILFFGLAFFIALFGVVAEA